MHLRPTRRATLRGLAASAGLGPFLRFASLRRPKLRIGVVGSWNRGRNNLEGVMEEDVVAVCDVDSRHLGNAVRLTEERSGKAPRAYADWRRLLDEEELDGLVVSTPDHTHFHPSFAALERGMAVYCEKPLAHTVEQVRALQGAAAKAGVATQMGTQIHAGGNYRRVVELVRSGAIGAVREVHVRCPKSWSDGRFGAPKPAPDHLDWDLWQGPVPGREYCDGLHPANWRRFWDYGTGTLGDMACHYVDLVHWALDLGVPAAVEAEGPELHAEGTPKWLHVTWEHAASKARPEVARAPVTVHWWDGDSAPEELPPLTRADGGADAPWGSYQLFVGERGTLISDYGRHVLYPQAEFADHEPPERTIPDSVGHYREWTRAIRGEGETTCSFDYSGDLTAAVLLGNVAFRAGRRLERCDEAGAEQPPEVARLLNVPYRDGW